MRSRTLQMALLILSVSAVRGEAREEVGCCDACGTNCGCQKVCRLVCEEKKVEIICWGCKCEDFCVPAPSKRGCKHCEMVCSTCDERCDCEAPHAKAKKFVWFDWAPTCAQIFTKTKLMQKKETKTVKSFKWVVEDLCAGCESKAQCASIEAGAEIPAPPVVDAKLLYNPVEVARAGQLVK